MTTHEVQDKIIERLCEKSFAAFCTNTTVLAHEADVLGINSSGVIYEFEVKISRGDFLQEFKSKVKKHKLYSEGKYTHRTHGHGERSKIMEVVIDVPNRYYFACPEGMIRLDEVPSYAGLIYVSAEGTREVKKAPMLHTVKANEVLLRNLVKILSYRLVVGCSYGKYKHEQRNSSVTHANSTTTPNL